MKVKKNQNPKKEDYGIWSHHFMANRWGKSGKSDRFLCSWALKALWMMIRCLLLGRKAMTDLDSILKNGDITLLKKSCIVKAMVFPVVMYRCESWTIKKAEDQRSDAFEL